MDFKKFLLFVVVVGGFLGVLYYFSPMKPAVLPTQVQPSPPTQPVPSTTPAPSILESTFKQAQVENKNVFLFLTKDPCIFCERMKKETLPKCQTELQAFVYFETKDQTIHNQYKATAFPTFLVLDKTGKEMKRHVGYLNAHEFKRWLER